MTYQRKLIDMLHKEVSCLQRFVIFSMASISMTAQPASLTNLPTPKISNLGVMNGSDVNGERVLVVSKDGEQCPEAEFTTIQDAVNAASAGDVILVCSGIYQEMVTISGESKNNLQIRPHSELDSVVLDGMSDALEAGFLLQQVSGVVIEGFTVQGFQEANIWLRNADSNIVRRNDITASGHDGIELLDSAGNLIEDNQSFDHLASNACGIDVLGSGSRGNMIRHNLVQNTNWGIQVVVGAIDNVVFENRAVANRDRGIRTVNATGTVIDQNNAEQNPMGIAIVGSTEGEVARNESFGNTEFDLFWDGQGSVTFIKNRCDTSEPKGLCNP